MTTPLLEPYRQIVEHAADAYFLITPEHRVIDVNEAACLQLGYERDELIGLLVTDFADVSTRSIDKIFERLVPGLPTTVHNVHRKKDGTTFPVEVRLGAFFAEGQKLRVALARDVTERNRAEQALRASEQRWLGILRSAMDAILILDDTGEITLINDAAQTIFGCNACDLVGEHIDNLVSDAFRRFLGEHPTDGAPAPHRWLPVGLAARRANGEEFPVEGTVSDLAVSGITCRTIIMRDVQERLHAQQQIERLHRERNYLKSELAGGSRHGSLLGGSTVIDALLRDIDAVAPTDATVLIRGETGTGKELVARGIHESSTRSDEPFVKVNCAAIPETLIERELFGHERGAFTGAVRREIGLFELADGGTIFLDEIGDVSPAMQAKLLRVLEGGEVTRVGSPEAIHVNVRVVAATNRDLEAAVADGTFRADLFYRLNVVPLSVPPLREHLEDVPLLVQHFVERLGAKAGEPPKHVPESVMSQLASYHWPGNVRELENVIERAHILSRGATLELGDWLPQPTPTHRGKTLLTLDDVQRLHIAAVLERTAGRVRGRGGAAEILGMHPNTLDARIQKLRLR